MSRTFFIADTHFGADQIRRYECRPFDTVEQMDAELIGRWNATVTDEDEVFVLGDFGAEGCEEQILSKLHGKKYLVKGNHDINTNEYYRNAGFAEVYDLPVVYRDFWLLSHEPMYINRNMPYANVFGHVHDTPSYKDHSSQHFCVCVERIGYRPVPFSKIMEKVKEDSSCE